MNKHQREQTIKEKEDFNNQCFDSMMNSLFDIANELHDRLNEDVELTEAEATFLQSFDTYIDSACELIEIEEGNESEIMTQEEFDKGYKEPVDLDEVHAALKRFINGKARLSIPASPDDDDMLVSRLMDEVKRYRELGEIKNIRENNNVIQFNTMSEKDRKESLASMYEDEEK
ncbi:hypothetical protein F4V43_02000 [Paenibacillus spiritus]|uniref:Uncharacterized protein n=1 Tax=Paenibacillus spiritus TaxID=2496557 RepID=A0A5J5GHU8_9BACL|nr:hypothetical protein [Paenibacillus spiritus]KAA9007282.1 hypothetical protein F4V43_02000 [Paenibacillus spiritus]